MQENHPVPIGPIKTRARILSLRFFGRLLAAALALYVFQYVLNLVISLADMMIFGTSTEVTVVGINVSVTYEVFRLLATMLWAPIALGVSGFYLGAARGEPGRFADIFSWISDKEKRRISVKYGVFQIVFGLITFPLQTLPVYYLYEKLQEFVANAQTSLSVNTSSLVTRETSMALVMILIYALVSLPFLALPYVLCDLYKRGFGKCFRYSTRLMLNFVPRFVLFALSFALWILFGSFIIVLLIFFVVYFRVALVSLIDYLRVGTAREPYFAEEEKPDDSDEEERFS